MITSSKNIIFTSLINDIKLSDTWKLMVETVENSAWHREASIAVHTEMVLTEYDKLVDHNTKDYIMGYFVCLFHDTGKPIAKEVKINKEGESYNSFAGHELISARLWEDFAVTNYKKLEELGIHIPDIYKIGYMIEHHLPYGLKNQEKLDNLRTTLEYFNIFDVFINVLKADCFGRISDNHADKKLKVLEWVEDFTNNSNFKRIVMNNSAPILYMTIGASGSGKSTFSKQTNCEYYSWDNNRLNFYSSEIKENGWEMDEIETYEYCFDRSCEDEHFRERCDRLFSELLRTGKDIIVDNVNISAKKRKFFIHSARNRGYNVVAFLFPINLKTLEDRHKKRPDKRVSWDIVKRMYMGISLPSLGEFDNILPLTLNFDK